MELKLKTMAIEGPSEPGSDAELELRPAVLDAAAEPPKLPERTS